MNKLLLILLCLPMIGFGQACQYGSGANATELCNLFKGNSFSSDRNADRALDKVLSTTGLAKNFILQQCNGIDNCVATSYKGIRYILYDKQFMSQIANSNNVWPNLSILAHEIGHHVNGHSLDLIVYEAGATEAPTLIQSRQMELEADEYSGFVMYKLGASLSQAQEAIRLISSNKDDSYSTHPKLDKRLVAIKKGYNNAKRQGSNSNTSSQSPSGNAEDYYDRAKYHSNPEYQLDLLWLAVKANPEYWEAWELMGDIFAEESNCERCKEYNIGGNCQSYNSALINYNKAIRINPNRAELYSKRADVLGLILNLEGSHCLNGGKYANPPLDVHQKNLYKNYHNQLDDRLKSIEKGILNKVKAYKECAELSMYLATANENYSGPVWTHYDVINFYKSLIQLEPANAWWEYKVVERYKVLNWGKEKYDSQYNSQVETHKSKLNLMINKLNDKKLLEFTYELHRYSWKSYWDNFNPNYNKFISVFLNNEEAQVEMYRKLQEIGYSKNLETYKQLLGVNK